jgi:hypothetical protein
MEPEAPASAELNRERIVFGRVPYQVPRIIHLLAVNFTHAPLQPRLPGDARVPNRLRVADIAGTAELAECQVSD